jgi:tetratricopeptide (TPR) repeat protein
MRRPRYWIGPTLAALVLIVLLGWTLTRRVSLERARTERARDRLADGQSHRQKGEHDEAEQCWRQALELDPKLSAAWLSLGRLALERDQPAEAVGLLERALALSPKAHEVIYTLSLAERRLGHLDVAERLRERARGLREAEGPPRGGMGSMPEPAS